MQHERTDTDSREENSLPRIRFVWVFWSFFAVALVFMLLEHRAHLYGPLPYLLLLACPLMHLFMHHGHSDHAGHGPRNSGEPPRTG